MAKNELKADMSENQKAAAEFSEYAAKEQEAFMENNAKEREALRKDPEAFLKKKREEVFAEVKRYQEEMAKLAEAETPFSREAVEISQAEFYESTGHTSLAQIAKTAEEVGKPTLALSGTDVKFGAATTENVDVDVNKKQVENEKKNSEASKEASKEANKKVAADKE